MICEDDMLELLHSACRSGDAGDVQRIIDTGVNLDAVITGQSQRALATAALCGRIDICELLIEHGADIKPLLTNGKSMSLAAEKGDLDVCKFLIRHGANVNLQADGTTPLTNAAKEGNILVCGILLDHGAHIDQERGMDPCTPLTMATYAPMVINDAGTQDTRLNMCSYLLERGANIDYQNEYRHTTLMVLAARGDEKLCKFFLSQGANPNLLDSNGKSALDMAVEKGHELIIQMLRKPGKASSSRSHEDHPT